MPGNAVDSHATSRDSGTPCQRGKKRCLAGARRPEECDELARARNARDGIENSASATGAERQASPMRASRASRFAAHRQAKGTAAPFSLRKLHNTPLVRASLPSAATGACHLHGDGVPP